MLTIRPHPRAIIAGATARAHRNIDVRLVARIVSQSASVTSSVFCCMVMPALFTRTSIGPSPAATAPVAAAMSSARVTSSRNAAARPPPARISPATASTWSVERAAQATDAPAWPRASALARPMPRLAPVPRATRPARSGPAFSATWSSTLRRQLLGDELAEPELLDLPARRHRKLGDRFDALRELLPRELLGLQVRHDLGERHGLARLRDDERTGPFLQARIRHPDDRDAGDLGVGEEEVLHLGHRDVLAAPDDEVLGAPGDREAALGIERGAVARLEPAVRRVGLAGEVGPLEVADELRRGPHEQVALSPRRHVPSRPADDAH